jgi:hypothetical protein
MDSLQTKNVLCDSKSQKQRSVVITYENTVVYRDVGACSMMFKLHANRILSREFQAQKGCYVSLLLVCFFTSCTVNVMLGMCSVI